MAALGKYTLALVIGVLLGLGLMYWALTRYGSQAMSSGDGTISRVTVTPQAPVQALDKRELRAKRAIPKAVEQDAHVAVLAAGAVKDPSGSRDITAVMDLRKGTTEIVENRPIAEVLKSWDLGIGAGLVDGHIAEGARAQYTFGRVWNFYGSADFEIFNVERPDNRNPWNAMLWATYRF